MGARSVVLRHQREQGHGYKVTNCISISLLLLVDLSYVDYGELLEAAQSGKECSERVAERLQALVNIYISGIKVTGGGCKP